MRMDRFNNTMTFSSHGILETNYVTNILHGVCTLYGMWSNCIYVYLTGLMQLPQWVPAICIKWRRRIYTSLCTRLKSWNPLQHMFLLSLNWQSSLIIDQLYICFTVQYNPVIMIYTQSLSVGIGLLSIHMYRPTTINQMHRCLPDNQTVYQITILTFQFIFH